MDVNNLEEGFKPPPGGPDVEGEGQSEPNETEDTTPNHRYQRVRLDEPNEQPNRRRRRRRRHDDAAPQPPPAVGQDGIHRTRAMQQLPPPPPVAQDVLPSLRTHTCLRRIHPRLVVHCVSAVILVIALVETIVQGIPDANAEGSSTSPNMSSKHHNSCVPFVIFRIGIYGCALTYFVVCFCTDSIRAFFACVLIAFESSYICAQVLYMVSNASTTLTCSAREPHVLAFHGAVIVLSMCVIGEDLYTVASRLGSAHAGDGFLPRQRRPLVNLANFPVVRAGAGSTCSICLENMDGALYKETCTCASVNHEICLREWFYRSRLCPMCRRDVTS